MDKFKSPSMPEVATRALNMMSRTGKGSANNHLMLLKLEKGSPKVSKIKPENINLEEYFSLMGNNPVEQQKTGISFTDNLKNIAKKGNNDINGAMNLLEVRQQ